MALPYCEGTVFAVPLRAGGFATGLVARAPREGGVLLGYFFGPALLSVPDKEIIKNLSPESEIQVLRFGDLSLLNSEWPIVGQLQNWKRAKWPMPPFVRKDDMSKKAWRVNYSDDDPSVAVNETPEPFGSDLDRDTMYGAGAVELLLTRLLKN